MVTFVLIQYNTQLFRVDQYNTQLFRVIYIFDKFLRFRINGHCLCLIR